MVCGAIRGDGKPCQRTGKCPWHNECPVCLVQIPRGSLKRLPCGHAFHADCIDRWKSTGHRTCPVCRFEFVKPEYRVILTVSRTSDGATGTTRTTMNDAATEIFHRLFQLDLTAMNDEGVMTDIQFDVENRETLTEIIREIGVDLPFLRT